MFVVDGTAPRILRGVAATLTFQGRDSDGEPADPGTVTVGVTRSDGTEVIAAGTATTATGTTRTVALTAAQTAQLDVLYATWTVSGTEIASTRHDVVGGFYFGIDDLRGAEPSTATSPTLAEFRTIRAYVETLIEQATGTSFVPRFDVAVVDGSVTRDLALPRWYLRDVRWVRLWSSNTIVSTLDSTEIAAMQPSTAGILHLDRVTAGLRVEVGFEHGTDAPPADVAREAIRFAREQTHRGRTRALPEAATSMRMENGSFVTLATPGVGNWHTGITSVDDMIRRYARSRIGIA
jgi:hypothetical protein